MTLLTLTLNVIVFSILNLKKQEFGNKLCFNEKNKNV